MAKMSFTPTMRRVLLQIADFGKTGAEFFGSDFNTAVALKKRGLAQCGWIGMRYWRARATATGLRLAERLRAGEQIDSVEAPPAPKKEG